jgi:hypothetical protein
MAIVVVDLAENRILVIIPISTLPLAFDLRTDPNLPLVSH